MLPKTKLNSIEVLISKALTDSYISHNEFISVNDVLREYDDMRKENKNLNTSAISHLIVWSVQRKQKVKTQGSKRQKREKQCFDQNVWCVAAQK